MYIENLNHEEQVAFMKLSRLVLYADGIIAREEVEFFEHLKRVTGVNETLVQHNDDPAQLVRVFASRQSRVSALLQLIAMGYVDGNYDETEQKLCTQIGLAMGFDETELAAFESWVVRQTMLLQEAQSFWTYEEEE